ncbi:hypothetical protein JCM21900_006196 [Sporobolomyces salmonicolor]
MLFGQALSDVLGGLSILTWLGAQSPQIYENYKNGSVEGLALPFLVSWFFGDFTNLVGCILTRQLPFQTYLAAYFLVVDVILCGQFAYYRRRRRAHHLPPLSESFPYAQGPAPHGPHVHPRHPSRSRKRRSRSSRGKSSTSGSDDPMQASWMSESSRSVSSPQIPARPLGSRRSSYNPSVSTSSVPHSEPPSPTLPERGRTLTRAPLPFDPTLSTIYGSPASGGVHSALMHHVAFMQPAEEEPRRSRTRSLSSRSRPPPPSRRSTSIVFLSVGLLVTFGKLGGVGGSGAMQATSGRAWSTGVQGAGTAGRAGSNALRWAASARLYPRFSPSPAPSRRSFPPLAKRSTFPLDVSTPPSSDSPSLYAVSLDEPQGMPNDDRSPPSGPDYDRFIGRASAWLCTTLYLTSRLPQIWQNFRRRSVEGLAMSLFGFAFLGNSLYVASILTNPLLSTVGYLLESLPYLLGSGGTLCFDLMIIAQSYLYSEKRKARKEHERRRHAAAKGFDVEEEAALLDAADETETETDGGGLPDRSGSGKRSSSRGHARSISSRRTISTSRSDSTELGKPQLSRAERGILEDAPFDFDGVVVEEGRWPARSASRSRTTSGGPTAADTIFEEGESSVTLRG